MTTETERQLLATVTTIRNWIAVLGILALVGCVLTGCGAFLWLMS